jgi:Lrp/AsnC family transcriptional regulator for asnA, asnC and gidA
MFAFFVHKRYIFQFKRYKKLWENFNYKTDLLCLEILALRGLGHKMQRRAKIDETDAKILKMLLRESRTSFTDIAKECKISVGAVRMRYKQLWKEGVINGEIMLVNPHSLGYRHIIDLGVITAVENEEEVAEFLEGKTYISAVVCPVGKYNFYGKAALRDLNDLESILEDLESNRHIKHVDALIWAEAVNIEYPQNLVIKPLKNDNVQKNNHRPPPTSNDEMHVHIDETDRKIAIILSEKSRTPFRKIAEQLGISTKNVIQRYKRLRENVLPLSTITVDLNKLGYNALANLYLKIANRSKMSDIYAQLLQIPNLIVLIRLIGPYDLYACVALEDFGELFKVLEQIRRMNGIETTDNCLGPTVPSWPLNLFPSLLKSEVIQPKYWYGRRQSRNNKEKAPLRQT